MKTNKHSSISFIFFGTDEFSLIVLKNLLSSGFLPSLVITVPDKPAGRGKKLTPSPVKIWAKEKGVKVLQPENLDTDFAYLLPASPAGRRSTNYDLIIVASYGKIIPKEILEIPEYGSLNVHPSLLPRFRGASPIESQILEDEKIVGATIILMDEKMDHGPILAQEIFETNDWPPRASELEKNLAHLGGTLLAGIISDWIDGNIDPQEQEHRIATFTKKIEKKDAEIDLEDDSYKDLLKIRAYEKWPRAYFFVSKGGEKIRITVTEAHMEGDKLILDKVIPEGKKEMNWQDFKRNLT